MPERAWRVVVVDDNFDDLQIILTTLEYYAIEVHAAANANECRRIMQRITPDLVITDLAMPDVDGWAVLDMVRNNPDTAHIPVVVITAYHTARLADEVMRSGFNGYFPKPIDTTHFVSQLGEIINA